MRGTLSGRLLRKSEVSLKLLFTCSVYSLIYITRSNHCRISKQKRKHDRFDSQIRPKSHLAKIRNRIGSEDHQSI